MFISLSIWPLLAFLAMLDLAFFCLPHIRVLCTGLFFALLLCLLHIWDLQAFYFVPTVPLTWLATKMSSISWFWRKISKFTFFMKHLFLFCQPIYFFPLFTCLVTKTIVYPFPCYSIIFFLWTLLSHDICSCSTKFFHSPVEWKNPQELEQSLHHFCYSCISSIGLFPLRNRFLIGGFSCRNSLFWSLTSVVREWKAG